MLQGGVEGLVAGAIAGLVFGALTAITAGTALAVLVPILTGLVGVAAAVQLASEIKELLSSNLCPDEKHFRWGRLIGQAAGAIGGVKLTFGLGARLGTGLRGLFGSGGEAGAAEIGAREAATELEFGRKLDFLFDRNINQSNIDNAFRARGNASRIGIADTPANRAEVIRRFNDAFNDPNSIVGPGNIPGSNLREFFLPGVTGTGSKIQFVELNGKTITIIAK